MLALAPDGAAAPVATLSLTASSGRRALAGSRGARRGALPVRGPPSPGGRRRRADRRRADRRRRPRASTSPCRCGPDRPARLAGHGRRPDTVVVGSGGGALLTFVARDAFGNSTFTAGLVALDRRRAATTLRIDIVGAATLAVPAPVTYAGRDTSRSRGGWGRCRPGRAADHRRRPDRVTLTLGAAPDRRRRASGGRCADRGARSPGHADRHPARSSGGSPTARCGTCAGRSGRLQRAPMSRPRARTTPSGDWRGRRPSGVSAEAGLEVVPPPERVLFGAPRGACSTTWATPSAPASSREAMRPFQVKRLRFLAGLALGYLRDDLTLDRVRDLTGAADHRSVAGAGRRPLAAHAHARSFELGAELGAGSPSSGRRCRSANGGGPRASRDWDRPPARPRRGSELGIPLRPGSPGRRASLPLDRHRPDVAGGRHRGNSVGLLGDIGYRMAF